MIRQSLLALSALMLFSTSNCSVTSASEGGLLPISKEGRALAKYLDDLDVEHHWLLGMTIEWRSGKTLHTATESGVHTHCSAFAAAACAGWGAPILSPPPQANLANRQQAWLVGEGARHGWAEVNVSQAQRLANDGYIVLA